MWPFKRKVKEIEGAIFKVGDRVSFKRRGDYCEGLIYAVKKDENNNILYDVQIGGECPAIITKLEEKALHKI